MLCHPVVWQAITKISMEPASCIIWAEDKAIRSFRIVINRQPDVMTKNTIRFSFRTFLLHSYVPNTSVLHHTARGESSTLLHFTIQTILGFLHTTRLSQSTCLIHQSSATIVTGTFLPNINYSRLCTMKS
jgi:hypothetical protein